MTEMVVKKLTQVLGRRMAIVSTRVLTRTLVPTLPFALAPTVTHSLTHAPKTDYYCMYCAKHSVYCAQCKRTRQVEAARDYYVSYYAGYYSKYYTGAYVQIGDAMVRHVLDDPSSVSS